MQMKLLSSVSPSVLIADMSPQAVATRSVRIVNNHHTTSMKQTNAWICAPTQKNQVYSSYQTPHSNYTPVERHARQINSNLSTARFVALSVSMLLIPISQIRQLRVKAVSSRIARINLIDTYTNR
jgi:hypothetical protein